MASNTVTITIIVGDLMFLVMQDFDFCPNLINFAQVLITFAQFVQILPKFRPKKFPRGCGWLQQ